MGIQRQSGFTIIEVMLFIAISAVLATALMVGWTLTVNTQSYRDSSRSFATMLQQQYTDTVDVSNGRNNNLGCNVVNGSTAVSDTGEVPIGQSDCVIMGRLLDIDGSDISLRTVVGYEPATQPDGSEPDKDIIASYAPSAIDSSVIKADTYQIPWSSRPYLSKEDTNTAHVAILIIRSPQTGTVYTYTINSVAEGNHPTVQNLLDLGTQDGVKLCLDPETPVAQGRMAVAIGPYASSSNAVSVLADSEAGC